MKSKKLLRIERNNWRQSYQIMLQYATELEKQLVGRRKKKGGRNG